MKRVISLLLALVLVFALTACGDSKTSKDGEAKGNTKYADEAFMADLSKGFMARWDKADEIESEGISLLSEEYPQYVKEAIDKELKPIAKYRNETFKDNELQEDCISLLNNLEKSKEIIEGVTTDFVGASEEWANIQAERAKLIEKFVTRHGLEVTSKYQIKLNQILDDAKSVVRDEEKDTKIKEMLTSLDFQLAENDYGYKTYTATLTNNSGEDLDSIYLTIDLLDESGTVIEQAYASADAVKAGKNIKLEFSTDKDFSKYEIHPEYY